MAKAKFKNPAQGHYHITYSPPYKNEYVDRPNGSWSVYRITGDQIAERIVFNERVGGKTTSMPHYTGGVIARYAWCGYIGLVESLDEVKALIETDMAR